MCLCMPEYKIDVDGMTCGGCETTIEQAVGRVNGVNDVNADHETETVTVTGDDPDRDGIHTAIERVGYDVSA